MAFGEPSQKSALSGTGSTRVLESQSGAMRRAARRLRRGGYARASEQMALAAEQTQLNDRAIRGGSAIRSADAEKDKQSISERSSRVQRALAAGFRPDTQSATGDLLTQRRSLFEEMKAARAAGQDVNQFQDRATGLGVTSEGFERAVGKLPQPIVPTKEQQQPGGTSTAPATPSPSNTNPAGPGAPGGQSPVQDAGTKPPPAAPAAPAAPTTPVESPAAETTPPPTEPPAAGRTAPSPVFEQEAQALIGGLTPKVATSISEGYAGIPQRVQDLATNAKEKYGLEYSEADKRDAEASLRRNLNERTKAEMLTDLRKTNPVLAQEFERFYKASAAITPDSDPREVLSFIREKMGEENVNRATEERTQLARDRKAFIDKLRKAPTA